MKNLNNILLISVLLNTGLLTGIIIGHINANKNRPSYEYGINIVNDKTVTIHSIHRDTTYECAFEDIYTVIVKDNL
jgi:hypothetical protein